MSIQYSFSIYSNPTKHSKPPGYSSAGFRIEGVNERRKPERIDV